MADDWFYFPGNGEFKKVRLVDLSDGTFAVATSPVPSGTAAGYDGLERSHGRL